MKRMHFAPPEVRARICRLLEENRKELIHLSYGSGNESPKTKFIAIAHYYSGEPPYCYEVISYDSSTDKIYREHKYLTYSNALIEMGKYINANS